MKLVRSNAYLVSTAGTEGVVLHHRGLSSHSVEYAAVHIQMVMG